VLARTALLVVVVAHTVNVVNITNVNNNITLFKNIGVSRPNNIRIWNTNLNARNREQIIGVEHAVVSPNLHGIPF
jgi:hypothetical protein